MSWQKEVGDVLGPELLRAVVEATGWAPVKVFPREGDRIQMVMPDGCNRLHIKVDAQGKFVGVVERR